MSESFIIMYDELEERLDQLSTEFPNLREQFPLALDAMRDDVVACSLILIAVSKKKILCYYMFQLLNRNVTEKSMVALLSIAFWRYGISKHLPP